MYIYVVASLSGAFVRVKRGHPKKDGLGFYMDWVFTRSSYPDENAGVRRVAPRISFPHLWLALKMAEESQ